MRKEHMKKLEAAVGEARTFYVIINDPSGSAMDLSGMTVTVSARLGSTVKFDGKAVTLVAAASGSVSFDCTSDDLDTIGRYFAQFKIVNGGEITRTKPFAIVVEERIGT